jgi:hypothetical protein
MTWLGPKGGTDDVGIPKYPCSSNNIVVPGFTYDYSYKTFQTKKAVFTLSKKWLNLSICMS